MKERAIAIITARGGSKRIPGKNKKLFCGKPILEYSIEAALSSGIFTEVMVSTDYEEIKEIAERAGAKVPFMRSEKTSNVYAPTIEVLAEVLEEYEKLIEGRFQDGEAEFAAAVERAKNAKFLRESRNFSCGIPAQYSIG